MSKKPDKSNTPSAQHGKKPAGSGKSESTPATDTIEVTRDDMHAAKSVARGISGRAEPAPPLNFRRSHLALQLFGTAMITALGSAAGVILWTRSWVEQRLAETAHREEKTAAPAPAAVQSGRTPEIDAQITALQQQLDAWRRDQLLNQKEMRESIERVASAAGSAPQQPMVAMNTARPPSQPGVESVAEMSIQVTPTQKEFIQLKERNRLTAYADEVIATGLRKPLETLVEYMRDPGSTHLHEAATAEYLRAVRAIQTLQREDPGYRLPVADLFKDSGMRDEADLKPDALFKLLDDTKQPWEVRVRAAVLLKGSDLKETNEKLIRVIKEDPSLDVAKHAQICLEQRIGRRFRMFDIPAIESWWKAQGNG
ncbi:MAG: hypothetical protein JNG86_11055 [Verrucomicrobiaceae bacterium]|nr:hypothetical protein [Verrucomicrobiaceae bacterium]